MGFKATLHAMEETLFNHATSFANKQAEAPFSKLLPRQNNFTTQN